MDWNATSIEWCEAFELEPEKSLREMTKITLVPMPLVAMPGDGTLIQRNTDGIAAGFDWQQAVLHGIQEVWERHCYSLALANCHAKALPLGILQHPEIQPLLSLAEQIGSPIFLKDISLEEVGIYCVYAVVFDQSAGFRLVNSGTGCALGLLDAARSALYEALQSRLVAIAGAREDIEQYVLEKNILNNDFKVFSYWYDNSASPPVSKYILTSDLKNVEDSLLEVLRLISNSGFKVFFVPFTDDSLVEKVGRIIIPGAEQWAGDRSRVGTRIAESLINLQNRILN